MGIYVVSDWNEMEPWTWIIQAFYMMVGSWYYMATRSDWAYTSVYGSLQERYYNKIADERKFSFEKVEALEEYVKTIEEQKAKERERQYREVLTVEKQRA